MVLRRCLRLLLTATMMTSPVAASPIADTDDGNVLSLTFPESTPFWLPSHLNIESLRASFPCEGGPCRFRGQLQFERSADAATVQVNATLSRQDDTLAIRGNLQMGSGASAQTISQGKLHLSGIRHWLPRTFPDLVRQLIPNEATLNFLPGEQPAAGQWPMRVSLTTKGGARPAFEGEVILHTTDPWRLEIPQGRLTAGVARMQAAGWLFNQLDVDVPMSGSVTSGQTRLTLRDGAKVSARLADSVMPGPVTWANGLKLLAGGMVLSYRDGVTRIKGPASLSTDEFRYPGLVTQAWRADATLSWQQELDVEGELSNAAGTLIPFRVGYDASGALDAAVSMNLDTANEANHLAETLSAWPQTLTLEKGEIDATANVRWSPESEPDIFVGVTFEDASGLYRNMAWERLSGRVNGEWRNGALRVTTEALELAELNAGIPIGPVLLNARYRAETKDPGLGTISVDHLSAGFAGGTLNLSDATSWTMSGTSWEVPVGVAGVKLSALMNLYPTEGLSGEGTLEGHLPIVIGPEGVSIDNGFISALPPGGRLQLPAGRLGGMAQANAAMALVAKAMENFHFRLLESGINYDEDGTLLLDLTLRGSSPEVDSDRPVVLNINLQEDVPALLTSLQLSGRVNDAIRERVRERLLQEDAESQ